MFIKGSNIFNTTGQYRKYLSTSIILLTPPREQTKMLDVMSIYLYIIRNTCYICYMLIRALCLRVADTPYFLAFAGPTFIFD